jgi:hypothetical protein
LPDRAAHAALTSTLESAEAGSGEHRTLEGGAGAVRPLDRMPVGNDNASAFAHLEQRVSYLLERLEASSNDHSSAAPAVDLGRVEEGLHDILRSLERQHASLVALADSNRNSTDTAQPVDTGIVDLVKRELSDIRFSQSETDRRTQDSLETVHSTLGHVVDRLSTIEGDLRTVRTAPAPRLPLLRRARKRPAERRAFPRPRTWRRHPSRIAEPAACKQAARIFCRRAARIPRRTAGRAGRPAVPPRAISETWTACRRAAYRDRAGFAAGSSARTGHPAERADVFAVGTDRRFRKRDQRNHFRAEGAGQFVELHCRRTPRRAGRSRRPAPREGGTFEGPAKGQGRRQGQGGRQGRLEHYLPDPLAAGRRERGRNRARHVQDGDDAARHRQRAATADDGAVRRAGRSGSVPCAGGGQHHAGGAGALDDLADTGRETVEQFFRTEHAG